MGSTTLRGADRRGTDGVALLSEAGYCAASQRVRTAVVVVPLLAIALGYGLTVRAARLAPAAVAALIAFAEGLTVGCTGDRSRARVTDALIDPARENGTRSAAKGPDVLGRHTVPALPRQRPAWI